MKLSARNIIAGKITRISKGTTTSTATARRSPRRSPTKVVAEFGLSEGQTAHAVTKASDVMIGG